MYLQALTDGVLLGGVYALIAVGLSLAFGVMGIINWAHGELLMLAMFFSYYLVVSFGMDPYLSAPIGMILFFGTGFLLQKFVFGKLLSKDSTREPTSVLLSTAGLGMILWNVATMIFGSNAMTATTTYTGKSIWIADSIMVSIPKLISFAIAVLAIYLLHQFLNKTNMGRGLRATSQNRDVARLMGINVNKIFCIAFGISIGLVALSGALLIPNYSVYAKVGEVYSNKAFIIVALGGKGNIRGTLVGGLIIGIIERMGAIILNESYGQMLTFVFFIVILLWKPNGIFGKSRTQS